MPAARASKKKDPAVNLDTLGLEMGNKPPQALDVEEAVLGALLVEPSAIDEAMEELSPSCFYDPRNRMVFEAVSALVNEHVSVDLITVAEKLRAQGNLEAVGGPVALANMSQKIGAAAHIGYYIKILKQKCIQRDLITASYDILKEAYDDSVNVDTLVDIAQSKVYDAVENSIKKDVQDIGAIINRVLTGLQEIQGKTGLTGVPSGYPTIDRITQGWQRSNLIILAARPSVGKTAFALNLARNAAVEHNMPVAFFSLEMACEELGKRLITSESGLSADKIKGGVGLEPYEWVQLEVTLKRLSKAPLYFDDTGAISLMEFRSKAKRLVHQHGVRLIIVDYLQLMQAPVSTGGIREQEVAAISRTLKQTAKELEVPVIALSQLSRNSVRREGGNGRPQLSDLRESGSIEQDADMVIFIHRPDAIGLAETVEDRERCQVIIAKHRNGETADIEMRFKHEQVRFIEADDTLDNIAESLGATAIGSGVEDFEASV